MKAEDDVAEDRRKLDGGDGHLDWDDVDIFGETVHEDSDGIVTTSSLWQGRHEVHDNGVPAAVWDCEGL